MVTSSFPYFTLLHFQVYLDHLHVIFKNIIYIVKGNVIYNIICYFTLQYFLMISE